MWSVRTAIKILHLVAALLYQKLLSGSNKISVLLGSTPPYLSGMKENVMVLLCYGRNETLVRIRSGHARAHWHVTGLKVSLPCPNCNCKLWFQQDGATCHTARATIINLLKDTFGDRLISRFGPVNWPPRSCDSTPLDYFLWGYADKPQTLDHLEDNIRRVIANIQPQMLEKVIENWTSRFDYIRASRGSPMPEIIFKM
ncbi:DUF4817 domain-containing protein [Trichonephila clavipes]|nr:DUF4817 domain-containing protein [Trichonephila clavipes]